MNTESTIVINDIFNKTLDHLSSKANNKRNQRQSIMNMISSLSSIPVGSFKKYYSNMDMSEFYKNISSIFKQIESCTQEYINDNICYIKHPQDLWVQDFWALQKKYNNFAFLYENNIYTPEDIDDLALYAIETYELLDQIFNHKYQKQFK